MVGALLSPLQCLYRVVLSLDWLVLFYHPPGRCQVVDMISYYSLLHLFLFNYTKEEGGGKS